MQVPGRRKRRFRDVAKENMVVAEEDAGGRVRWHEVIHCGEA